MANLCTNFFFYIFLSGTILFLILAGLTIIGNPVILIENSQKDSNNEQIKEEGLKTRIITQYFIAAFADLVLAILFFILSIKKNDDNVLVDEVEENNVPLNDKNLGTDINTNNNQENLLTPEGHLNEGNSINDTEGMGEKDNLATNGE